MTTKAAAVIIGTTLGEAGDPVVATGAQVARAMGAAPHLVHAFTVAPSFTGAPYEPIALELAPGPPEIAAACRQEMEAQVARLALDAGGPLVRHVEQGPAHRVLSDVARHEGAELIVVGAADGFAAHVLGSTASRVVRRAECPVLVLRGALPVPPRKVLLAVDLSPISAEAVRRGLALLERWLCLPPRAGGPTLPWPGSQPIAIEAFHVVAPAGYEGFVPHFDLAGAERAGAERLDRFLAAAHCGGWQITRRACFGGPREQLLHRIAETSPDLVVLGTHGLSGFERFLIGSVAEAVTRSSKTSVLVVPPLAAAGVAAAGAPPPAAGERERPAA